MDNLFRALADPHRRQIVRMLRSDDMSAGQLSDQLPIAKSTLSGHLNVLKGANLVLAERSGTTIVYSLNIAAYEEIVAAMMDLLSVGEQRREPAPSRSRQRPEEDLA